jgi:hypothetical protein
MDATERSLLSQTVLDACASTDGTTVAVDRALGELGWLEMLRDEPRDAVAIVFGALGRTNASASVLDDVLVAALGIEPGPDIAMLLPWFGMSEPPATVESRRVTGRGLATARVSAASEMLVVTADGPELAAVRVATAALDDDAARGVDPGAGLHRVRLDVEDTSPSSLDTDAWHSAVAAGQVAVAHQIAGACRAMLELARTHARERVQFDRPIARFQAVRHRLADALVAIEALDASLVAAHDAPGPMTAALAKAIAGRAARTTATHCQQVLAGIGFTTDHPFHQFLKRTLVLDGVFGSTDQLTLELGRHLLRSRAVPTLIEL